jgi:hypothetical protein
MKIKTLKTLLSVKTGTDITQVTFDLSKWPTNDSPTQSYPAVVWNFNNAKFKRDLRTTIQVEKTITLAVFAIINFDPAIENEDDKIDKWDLLEGYFQTYLNVVNSSQNIKIDNINDIEGFYVPEGISDFFPAKAIGILFQNIVLHTYCNA